MHNNPKMTSVPDWAKALSSDAYFAQEQACLGDVWNFLGFVSDLPNENDWFRATLGGRSIFVQRFKTGLRAFENICPHRFNALRNEDKGNGPIVCGFHHWRFDGHGDAIGIPKCKELYNKTPKEMDAHLTTVETSVCGDFIFGRFGDGPSLQEWLGPAYAILSYVTADLKLGGGLDLEVKAHWKLMAQIGMDDYHLAAVHPTTFGKNGYLPLSLFHYNRFGVHNALVMGVNPSDINLIAQACQEKTFSLPKGGYSILQFFPKFVVSIKHIISLFGDDYCYLWVEQPIALSRHQTQLHIRFFLMPFSRPAGFMRQLVRQLAMTFINIVFKHQVVKITSEDIQVCENAQKVAHQIQGDMQRSAQEERVGWFEAVYAQYVTAKIKQKEGEI